MTVKRKVSQSAKNREIELTERRAKCVELVKLGFTFDQISEQLKYGGRGNAYRDYKKALEDRVALAVDELRETENMRLDAAFIPQYRKALKGDEKGTAMMLKIMERRAKLNGVDMPTQIETTGDSEITIVFSEKLNVTGMNDEGVVEVDRH